MKTERRLALIEAVLAPELDRLQEKAEFWMGQDSPGKYTLWDTPDSLDLESLRPLLRGIDLNAIDPDQQLLVGIAWEFIWDETPPAQIQNLRSRVMEKVKTEFGPITELEKLWFTIIGLDTDRF